MPILAGRGPLSGEVLSHDQVEAALMRRAGYEVRVLVEEGSSWEENPPTLLEFVRRELRWQHGNMQYLRLLGMPGLKPVSRVQLLLAILMYVGPPAWMAMTAIATIALALSDAPVSPLRSAAGGALFAILMGMTFAPKIASLLDLLARPSRLRSFGGAGSLVANALGETLFTILLSPIMAVAHAIFLVRLTLFWRRGGWGAQKRHGHATPWRLAAERLWPQTLAGLVLASVVSIKLPGSLGLALLTASGLILAVPFTVATASPRLGALATRWGTGRIPEETSPVEELAPLNLPALARRAPGKAQLAPSPAK